MKNSEQWEKQKYQKSSERIYFKDIWNLNFNNIWLKHKNSKSLCNLYCFNKYLQNFKLNQRRVENWIQSNFS